MLKECKVLLNNKAVTVIQYDDIQVQIPAIGRNVSVVKVKDDGRYTVVPDDYIEPESNSQPDLADEHAAVEKKTRARKKKTPVLEEVVLLEG